MSSRAFRIVIFTSAPPALVLRLAARIESELPDVGVCGVLYEQMRAKPLGARLRRAWKNLADPAYAPFVLERIVRAAVRPFGRLLDSLVRFVHACPRLPARDQNVGIDELRAAGKASGFAVFTTYDIHCPDALEFVRGLGAGLGLIYGTRILKPELFTIPRHGSINIHKRKVPDYRGGGPVGLWEMLGGEEEIGVTVHSVEAEVDAGAVLGESAIAIDPFDTLETLAAKARVVGEDLLIRTLAGLAAGTVSPRPQTGEGRCFRSPKPQTLRRLCRQLDRRRAKFRGRKRVLWKLLARFVLLAPFVVARNWRRRWQREFPVVILFLHLITDRPHRMGLPTGVFMRHLEYLSRHYRIVSLGRAIEMLAEGKVEAPTIALTFDDGYRENFINARAAAEGAGVPVSFFVCTGSITGEREFSHDLRDGVAGFNPLTWDQIRFLDAHGYEIGSHTRSHFDCGSVDEAALEQEIAGSKRDLEEQLGHEVTLFSFPWGQPVNISRAAGKVARACYAHVFSACGGVNPPRAGQPRWHLRRCPYPLDLLELELMIQSALELRRAPDLSASLQE